MLKYRREFRRFHKSIWGALALLVIFSFLLQNVAGSAYYSLLMGSSTAVSSPPVELEEGTAGNSTIYANKTSALVSVEVPVNGTEDFNYVLKFAEKDGSNWTVRLRAYDNSSITRLINCSIYIYDGSNSTQIVILNGEYENQTGSWYGLNATETEYIWMHVETSNGGTSYVYVYLEILVPDTTTYARYIITFEIT